MILALDDAVESSKLVLGTRGVLRWREDGSFETVFSGGL